MVRTIVAGIAGILLSLVTIDAGACEKSAPIEWARPPVRARPVPIKPVRPVVDDVHARANLLDAQAQDADTSAAAHEQTARRVSESARSLQEILVVNFSDTDSVRRTLEEKIDALLVRAANETGEARLLRLRASRLRAEAARLRASAGSVRPRPWEPTPRRSPASTELGAPLTI